MNGLESSMGLGSPVLPEVCARIKFESENHSFRKLYSSFSHSGTDGWTDVSRFKP